MKLQTIKPATLNPALGPSALLHLGLQALLPLSMFILVRGSFTELALALVLLSKWQMLAVQPRFWVANIRANAVDIMFGVSMLVFMIHAGNFGWQLVWALVYAGWLIYLKPLHSSTGISIQAGLGQLAALSGLFVIWADGPLYGLVLAVGLICYLSARHYYDAFDEPYARLFSAAWAYFGAGLIWVLGHWLLFYGPIAQPTFILSIVGYGIATLYHFDHDSSNHRLIRYIIIGNMALILGIVLLFSDWGSKIV